MSTARTLLPPWLAPAAGVGQVTKFERKAASTKVTLAIPVGSADVPVELTVPDDATETTALATALQALARVLLENRTGPMQLQLGGGPKR
ncbi:MAG: hypothetical protein A2Y61_00705 [Chloroflexi bacterium RBG_13_60_13]|nr:MAG: hypothetical protein A2Y61_00705 [Chloroflexi bacterium RBG_13_60_13]